MKRATVRRSALNERIEVAFNKYWKELKDESQNSYQIVKENGEREAFIIFVAGFMAGLEDGGKKGEHYK